MKLEAKANYTEYLQRMAQSANESTKSLLPLYFEGKKRILDVGCADGTMLEKLRDICPDAELVGLDICEESVNLTKVKGFEVHCCPIEHLKVDKPFDAILFSSVLHEVSSYAQGQTSDGVPFRFEVAPIESALRAARKLLTEDGIVVIRDGVENESSDLITFQFKDPKDRLWALHFMEMPPGKFMHAEFHFNANGTITTTKSVFRELMFKYTWGEASLPRESQEKVGILTQYDWMELVKFIGYTIRTVTTSSERYYEYLRPKVYCEDLEDAFSDATILMVLERGEINEQTEVSGD